MGKADTLAQRFEEASKDFEAKIKALSDQQWQAKTPEEGWTVAATAHHAAGAAAPLSMMAQAAATGSPMPAITQDMLHQMNLEHSQQFANATKEETLALLRQTTAPAAQIVRSLKDDQLGHKAMLPLGMELSAEQIIENVLIGHLVGHGASIQAAKG